MSTIRASFCLVHSKRCPFLTSRVFGFTTQSEISQEAEPRLCPQLLSQAPQHFRAAYTHATCDGCFARQSNLLGHFPRLLHAQESRATGVF